MNIAKESKKKITISFKNRGILLFFCAFLVFLAINVSFADNKENEMRAYELLGTKYQTMINLKQQQQMSLQNQLQIMDIQIDRYQNDIKIIKNDIENNTLEIKETQRQIDQKENALKKTKNQLAEMLRLYHRIDQELGLEFLSSGESFSNALNHSEYIDQISQKLDKLLGRLRLRKNDLEDQQAIYKVKKEELNEKKEELNEKISYSGTEKLSKRLLLDKTQGEEEKYKKLLSRVEKQKQELMGDLDALSSETRQALDKILANAPKPKNGVSSTKWYYSQDNKKWGYKRIGLSSSLMKDYGCAVTSLAMVFTYYDKKISPGKLSSQPIFYRDLIVWPQNWRSLELASSTFHGNVDWSTIKKEIKKENPVIVFVKARTGKGHYVVIHGRDKKGNYVVHDPLFGPNLYLSTTQKLIGAIYGTSTTIDQMLIYIKN